MAGTDANTLSAVPFTCRVTAGFRAIELKQADQPIIVDHLASELAGSKALAHAVDEWERLEKLQGSGKHLRVPARSRMIDDKVLELLSKYTESSAATRQGPVQVVCLGAGMDTRPWRLDFPCTVNYFEVDHPEVQHLKEPLLAAAGAEIIRASLQNASQKPTNNGNLTDENGSHTPTSSENITDGSATEPTDQASQQDTPNIKFPLKCSTWAGLGHDLNQPGLLEKLSAKGFDSEKPTIWVAEAVLYYLTLPKAVDVVRAVVDGSPDSSWFVLTCINQELYDEHLKLEEHVFAKLWHFYVDQLVPEMEELGFKVVDAPETTQQLARQLYGVDLYIPAEYGGFETLFTCHLQKK